MKTENYTVGQVLYVIPEGKALVVPVCVLEKRISETLEGVATQFIVKSPKPDANPVDLSTVRGRIYISIDEVRRVMLDNSRNAIEEMIERAENSAERAFGKRPRLPERTKPERDSVETFDLGDDSGAYVQIPHPHPMNGVEDEVEVRGPDGKMQKVKLRP